MEEQLEQHYIGIIDKSRNRDAFGRQTIGRKNLQTAIRGSFYNNFFWTTTQVDSSRLGVDKTAVFDSTNDSSRLVEKVSRLENDSSRVEWFFRLDSTPMVKFLMVDGEYWMMIGEHGDSAPNAPIMGNWCDWCSWRNFNHWWNLLNWWMVELANGGWWNWRMVDGGIGEWCNSPIGVIGIFGHWCTNW
ncbi:unnamed protein product [Caenorhabditis angaria]|uniref:Uncharacterized protein n=1 Tax=Caenorhabditis angaria TaxID=860376 RepID=A0A9P1I8E5_9PELO|nr:unnamed protein product [Caenorhabditis angaria]